MANLPHRLSYGKRKQLKDCLTGGLIGFDRQIQELLSCPNELATLGEVKDFINQAIAMVHLSEDRDKNNQTSVFEQG